jgi:hypothetical protein
MHLFRTTEKSGMAVGPESSIMSESDDTPEPTDSVQNMKDDEKAQSITKCFDVIHNSLWLVTMDEQLSPAVISKISKLVKSKSNYLCFAPRRRVWWSSDNEASRQILRRMGADTLYRGYLRN